MKGFSSSLLSAAAVTLPILGASAQNATVASLAVGAACGCADLTAAFPDQVYYPGSENYTTESLFLWDIRSDLSPACIFTPDDADDVASAMKTFVSCGTQFAVRAGGHMNYPGSNSIDGGIMMAFSNMKDYSVNVDTIDIGPGMNWFEVYSALDPFGRIAIGGRLKTIGASGLTLIGGFSYFNNKYGFSMDNVVSYDVVLGNGTAVVANSTSNPDLFWALKGGANNFGVVTKFRLATYEVPKISTTIQAWDQSALPEYIQAICDFTVAQSLSDVAAGSVLSIQYNATTKVLTPALIGVQANADANVTEFRNFTAIPGLYKLNNVTTPKAFAANLDSPKQMFRVQFGHHTILPNASAILEIANAWVAAVDTIADVAGLYPTFVLNTFPGSAAQVGLDNGIGNVWGSENEDTVIWQLSTGWDNAEDDLRMQAWSRGFVEHWHSVMQTRGLAREYLYMGDAGEWQLPFDTYPTENVERMREIRAAYDPLGTMSRLNWGGFKLGL